MVTSTVGFIGLGLMGQGFVKRLVATGHTVIVHDVVASKVEAAVEAGAQQASSPADIVARAGHCRRLRDDTGERRRDRHGP